MWCAMCEKTEVDSLWRGHLATGIVNVFKYSGNGLKSNIIYNLQKHKMSTNWSALVLVRKMFPSICAFVLTLSFMNQCKKVFFYLFISVPFAFLLTIRFQAVVGYQWYSIIEDF